MSNAAWYTATNNFKALDQWMADIKAQAIGTAQPGHKAQQSTFGGGITQPLTGGAPEARIAEQALSHTSRLDFSQGDLDASLSRDHLAIRGAGLFAMADSLAAGTAVVYSRDGEFHQDADGYFRDRQGRYLLSADDIDPEGNVVRDPVRFGRSYPADPFPPGALGVTEANFRHGTIADMWSGLTGGSGPTVSTTINETFEAVTIVTGPPSPTQWTATARTAGADDSAFGGPNAAARSVGWGVSTFGGTGAGSGLYYGDQTAGFTYATGISAATTLDAVIDWAPYTDVDLRVTEPGGGVVSPAAMLGNGFLNRDQALGMRPGGALADWDEWYSVGLLRPTGFAGAPVYDPAWFDYTNPAPAYGIVPTSAGAYHFNLQEAGGFDTSVAWQIIEDRLGPRAVTTSGVTALTGGQTAAIASRTRADRSHRGEVVSPAYALGGATVADIVWDQRSQVEALAAVDTMTFRYRLDGGPWSPPVDAKVLTANDGNWATVAATQLTGLGGNGTIQFKWEFDTVDGKGNDTYGWAIDNLTIDLVGPSPGPSQFTLTVRDHDGAIPPGSIVELTDAGGGVLASAPVTSNPAGDAVVLAFADAVPPAASLWPLTDATVRIRQGATLIAEHLYPNILKGAEASVDFRYRRGFEAALYPLPADDLQPGVASGTFTARRFADVPTFQPWGTNGAGRIVRAGLERSNAPLERLSIELAVAQRMYDGIAGVLKTRDHLSQSLFNLIR